MATHETGEVHYNGIHCDLIIDEYPDAVILVRISGSDVGEFGDAPLRHIEGLLEGAEGARLFIDARDVRGVSIEVSGEWAQWLAAHKGELREVHMLTGSRLNQITADFVRRFAGIQELMHIYTEPAAFDECLAVSRRSS